MTPPCLNDLAAKLTPEDIVALEYNYAGDATDEDYVAFANLIYDHPLLRYSSNKVFLLECELGFNKPLTRKLMVKDFHNRNKMLRIEKSSFAFCEICNHLALLGLSELDSRTLLAETLQRIIFSEKRVLISVPQLVPAQRVLSETERSLGIVSDRYGNFRDVCICHEKLATAHIPDSHVFVPYGGGDSGSIMLYAYPLSKGSGE